MNHGLSWMDHEMSVVDIHELKNGLKGHDHNQVMPDNQG